MANKIDNIFREGLGAMEVAPMSESWEAVQQRISNKKQQNYFWLIGRIAASIMLLLMATYWIIVWNNVPASSPHLITAIDHPTEHQEKIWNWDIQIKTESPEKTIQISKSKFDASQIIESHQIAQIKPIEIEKLKANILDFKLEDQSINLDTENQNPNIPVVKITYLASIKSNEMKQNKINDLIEFIRNESPGDLLADIRDTKDNLFKRN